MDIYSNRITNKTYHSIRYQVIITTSNLLKTNIHSTKNNNMINNNLNIYLSIKCNKINRANNKLSQIIKNIKINGNLIYIYLQIKCNKTNKDSNIISLNNNMHYHNIYVKVKKKKK